ncbi:hypothetical protein K933_12401 [Candidatus Halobonum tyrrellensis G22]|uniref:Uncharacterized protein n=1 Tax=Candidatus Halobonum tyrrellensis G22 TaxID=1324957 RepID=V4HAU0_9EURY|nr:hypothetical protein K933_12401 [Candidatus Halobonum tyrrellensis G22]
MSFARWLQVPFVRSNTYADPPLRWSRAPTTAVSPEPDTATDWAYASPPFLFAAVSLATWSYPSEGREQPSEERSTVSSCVPGPKVPVAASARRCWDSKENSPPGRG